MLGETEKSSDVCRTASLSEMGHEQMIDRLMLYTVVISPVRRLNLHLMVCLLAGYLKKLSTKFYQISWYGMAY